MSYALRLYPRKVDESPLYYFARCCFSPHDPATALQVLELRVRGQGYRKIAASLELRPYDAKYIIKKACALGLLRPFAKVYVFSRAFEERLQKLLEGYYGWKARVQGSTHLV